MGARQHRPGRLEYWTTGCADPFFPLQDQQDPVLFDAGNGSCCNWGTSKARLVEETAPGVTIPPPRLPPDRVRRRHLPLLPRLPRPAGAQVGKFTPRDEKAVGTLGSEDGADVFIHAGGAADDEPPIPAHSSVLEAYAPGFLKEHNLMTPAAAAASTDIVHTATAALRVDIDDRPWRRSCSSPTTAACPSWTAHVLQALLIPRQQPDVMKAIDGERTSVLQLHSSGVSELHGAAAGPQLHVGARVHGGRPRALTVAGAVGRATARRTSV